MNSFPMKKKSCMKNYIQTISLNGSGSHLQSQNVRLDKEECYVEGNTMQELSLKI